MSATGLNLELWLPQGRLLKQEHKTLIWSADVGSEKGIVKMYRHRGVANTIRGWAVRYRVQREHEHLEHLAAHGIPCTVPLGWTHGYTPEHGFYEILATREIEDAQSLDEVIRSGASVDLAPLFAAVRRMHEAGFRHQVLYARNIIVGGDPAEGRCFVCDVPRSYIFPGSILGTRLAIQDIADLVASLAAAGMQTDDIPLDAYGLPPHEKARFGHVMARYSKRKLRRTGRDVETRIRLAAAKLRNLVKA